MARKQQPVILMSNIASARLQSLKRASVVETGYTHKFGKGEKDRFLGDLFAMDKEHLLNTHPNIEYNLNPQVRHI
jgi:hypothetical protein